MSEEKSRGEFAVFIQQERKMKWYKKLWNVITGNKWRNKHWVLVGSQPPKYGKTYNTEKENR